MLSIIVRGVRISTNADSRQIARNASRSPGSTVAPKRTAGSVTTPRSAASVASATGREVS